MDTKQFREILHEISVDLQMMCEDNEVMRTNIEEYFGSRVIILGE